MKDRSIRSIVLAAFVAVIVPLGTQAASDTNWDRVIAAAKREGAVTMYANSGNERPLQVVADEFQKRYGITVTLSYANGSLNGQKVRAEAQTGHVLCDVFYSGLKDIETLSTAGYVVPLEVPNQVNVLPSLKVIKTGTPLYANVYGILVNTQQLGHVPLPTSWTGLLNAGLADKMVMQDPRVDGGGGTLFVATYDRLGPSFERKLAAQRPAINGAGSGSAAEESVARGDYTILIGGQARALEIYPQAPLKWVSPAEGALVVPIAMSMVKGAPHPNAARLWANFLLEPDVQTHFTKDALPVVKNVAIANPALRTKIKFLVVPVSGDRSKYYEDARQLYGQQ
jgi:ABC-type Fe3+ transport system substrate-binding protein